MIYKFIGGPEDGVETTFENPPSVGHVLTRLVQYDADTKIQVYAHYLVEEDGWIVYEGTTEVPRFKLE